MKQRGTLRQLIPEPMLLTTSPHFFSQLLVFQSMAMALPNVYLGHI